MSKEIRKLHQNLVENICMEVKNCADCYDEECKKVTCCPYARMDILEMTEESFCIEPCSEKTNEKLMQIAGGKGYKAEEIIKDNELTGIRFTITK